MATNPFDDPNFGASVSPTSANPFDDPNFNGKKTGFFNALKSGAISAAASDAAIGITGQDSGARKVALALNKSAQDAYQGVSLDEVVADPLSGKTVEYVKGALGQTLGAMPQYIAAGVAGTAAGAAVGTVVPGLGNIAGGIAGGIAGMSPLFYGSNMMRQTEEQEAAKAKGEVPQEYAYGKAALVAPVQAGMEHFGLGKLLKGTGVGKAFSGEGEKLTAEAAKLVAKEGLVKTVGKGIGRSVAAEVPVEIGQQSGERWQAGLDLTSPEAMKEYGETAAQTIAGVSPIGMVSGVARRSGARGQVSADEAHAQKEQDAPVSPEVEQASSVAPAPMPEVDSFDTHAATAQAGIDAMREAANATLGSGALGSAAKAGIDSGAIALDRQSVLGTPTGFGAFSDKVEQDRFVADEQAHLNELRQVASDKAELSRLKLAQIAAIKAADDRVEQSDFMAAEERHLAELRKVNPMPVDAPPEPKPSFDRINVAAKFLAMKGNRQNQDGIVNKDGKRLFTFKDGEREALRVKQEAKNVQDPLQEASETIETKTGSSKPSKPARVIAAKNALNPSPATVAKPNNLTGADQHVDALDGQQPIAPNKPANAGVDSVVGGMVADTARRDGDAARVDGSVDTEHDGAVANQTEGYDTSIKVNAKQFQAEFEKDNAEPLAWHKGKLDSIRNGTAKHSSGFPEVALGGKHSNVLGVNDGRHRIAVAAERGEDIDVLASADDARKITDRLNTQNVTAKATALTPLSKREEVAAVSDTNDSVEQSEVRITPEKEATEERDPPEVAQPTQGKKISFQAKNLNGDKKANGNLYELPGYKGAQLAVVKYKSTRGDGYRVYLPKSGVMIADNNGVSSLNDTLKLAVQRVSILKSKAAKTADASNTEVTQETSSNLAKNVKPSAEPTDRQSLTVEAKKLEVLKAQASGKITGDQADAMKQLAHAGEHAAVDEALSKPIEIDRNHFTIERLNTEINKMEPISFGRGEYVRYQVSGKDMFGEIDGISHTKREFSVDGLWYPLGFAYKAEKPAEVKAPTVPLSSVVDEMNAKHGSNLDYADRIATLNVQDDVIERAMDGKIGADEFKASFESLLKNKLGITAELTGMTKPQIFKRFPGLEYRYKNEKKSDLIDAAYRDLVSSYTLGESYSYGMGRDSQVSAIRAMVEKTTDESLSAFAEDIRKKTEERTAMRKEAATGIENPETLDDFSRLMYAKSAETGIKKISELRMMLPIEQRIKYDELAAEQSRTERASRKTAQQDQAMRNTSEVGASEIIKTKHTKLGHDLYQFDLNTRVSSEEFKALVSQAKQLGGNYSTYHSSGAIPGWQFKTIESAQAFHDLVSGDNKAAKEVMQARRDAYADDRSQSASERLNEMADALEEKADNILNQDRKANTARRARFAASAESSANADKAMAETMRNIAGAIEDGKANMLDRVRTKSQVEMLQGFLRTAQSDMLRKLYPSYAEQERHQGEKPTAETAEHVTFPQYTAFRSDLASLGRALIETEGTKKLGQQLMKVADDTSDAYNKFATENIDKVATFSTGDGKRASFPSKAMAETAISRFNFKGMATVLAVKRGVNMIVLSPSEAMKRGIWQGDNDKRISLSYELGAELVDKIGKAGRRGAQISVPWQFENARDTLKRLSAMNIETAAELRTAMREFIELREAPREADKIKKMERAMIGRRNDGMDFFPTPAHVADEMVQAADIKDGMSVLEPSAGMGHIADRIREAGSEPDVVELSSDRLELLEAKGYNVVGRDFMDINPREFFTYGDTFKAPDGTEGVMRSNGGDQLGSGRVRLMDGNGDSLGFFNRDELTPVRKNGSDSGYDRILMNPPFGDRRDAEHIQHAYDLLKPGGRLVSIMGEGVFFGSDKKAQSFRDWLEKVGATDEKLDEGTFNDPSLPVNTGANARMVVIDKPETENGVAMFSRKQSLADLQPVSESLIKSFINRIDGVRQVAGDTRITIATTAAELPEQVLSQAEAEGIPHDEIHGVLFNGRAYIVRQNLKTEQDVEEVLAHEVLGHGGVHALLGDAREGVLLESFNRAGGISQVRIIASRLGVLKELNQRIPTGKLSNSQKIAVVDEMLALAQGKQGNLRQAALEWVGKIRNFIIAGLRKAGLNSIADKFDKFDSTEAATMLRQMREAVIDGGDISGHGVAFMVAWPGSPHDHNKFDSSKIGTGEGAQAYGYGLYFAGNREVAEYYRNMLAGSGAEFNGVRQHNATDKIQRLALNLADDSLLGDSLAEKIATLKSENIDDADYRAAIKWLDENQEQIKYTADGKLYQVELAPSEDEYLLWDKPLSEQSEKVKAALDNAQEARDMMKFIGRNDARGEEIYKHFSYLSESDKAASEYLHSIGIRGIKYLDGSSRGDGEGTYNYVIFNDADVSITAKYSKTKAEVINQHTVDSLTQSLLGAHKGRDKAAIQAMMDNGKVKVITAEEAKGIIGEDTLYAVDREELKSKSVKAEYKKYQGQFPPSMPQYFRDEILSWKVISKSPYSDSFYDITNKGWDNDPDNFFRVADHWNFETTGRTHAVTDTDVANNTHWTLAEHRADGKYHVVKSIPKHEYESPEYQANRERQIADFQKRGKDIERTEKKKRAAIYDAIGSKIAKEPSAPLKGAGYNRVILGVTKDDKRRASIISQLFPNHIDDIWITRSSMRSVVSPEVASISLDRLEDALAAFNGERKTDTNIQYSKDDIAQAFFNPKDGITYFIADAISKDASAEELRGLSLHEISVHAFHLGKDSKEFADILRQVDLMRKTGNKAVIEAYSNVPKDTSDKDYNEEALAYLVQNHPGLPLVKRVIAWMRNAIRAIGKAMPVMQRLKMHEWAASLNEDDLMFMAKAALSRANVVENEEGGELLFSRRANYADGLANAEINNKFMSHARDFVADTLRPVGNQQFSLWQRTIGTQIDKARTNIYYKKVFDIGQKMLSDVSLIAQRAESRMPTLLPRSDTLDGFFNKSAWPEFKKTGNFKDLAKILNTGINSEDNIRVSDALTSGTLHGGSNPNAGRVWTDAELASKFGLTTDKQKSYYREARAAIDRSLDDLAIAEIIQDMRNAKIDERIYANIETIDAPIQIIADALDKPLASMQARFGIEDAETVAQLRVRITERVSTATAMKDAGYAPLMRFGTHTVTGYDEDGEVKAFLMFESKSEAVRAKVSLMNDPDIKSAISGELNTEQFKMFSGISPSTIEVFASNSSLSHDPVFQEYLKLAVANRSAMTRMIHRKGTAGFSNDATRTIASFITSNARSSSSAINMANLKKAVTDIPKEQGGVGQEAAKLVDYLSNPKEEAAKLRGFLFAQFLGFSIASGLVNMTQPALMTFPYLSQFGVKSSASAMKNGLVDTKDWFLKKSVGDADLNKMLQRAQDSGITAPQEIFQMISAAQGSAGMMGHKFMRIWGSNFAMTEAFNRVLTFSAAYRMGRDLTPQQLADAGVKDAYEFAAKTIQDTQGIYNKGNRPNWARGAVGATLFTFKQYSISYVEFLKQMYGKEKLPKKQFVVAIAMLLAASGANGLPGSDDLDDLIETLGYWLGYATNAKAWKRQAMTDLIGKDATEFALHGVSAIPFMPLDVSTRLGMANLIPGTAMLNPAVKDKSREITEVFGAAGGIFKSGIDAVQNLGKGDAEAAAVNMMPTAIRNAYTGYNMAMTGKYVDQFGNKISDVTTSQAVVKSVGFNPSEIAAGSRLMKEIRTDEDIFKAKKSEFTQQFEHALSERDTERLEEVRSDFLNWNADNPTMQIRLNMPQIMAKVRMMNLTREQRMLKSAPKEMRANIVRTLQND